MGNFVLNPYCDELIKSELTKIKNRVLNKDRDFVAVYDGEEGVGKSVLAQQHAKILDPNFTLDNIVFTSDAFITKIRDPKTRKGSCIVLDEAFNAANSRSSLTEVNRSMIALATEMRQRNLFVLLVLPSFFDLDRYFALWRCRALFHVYFTENDDGEEERRYVAFDKTTKKLLYLSGKKTYNYTYPKSPFPPATFFNQYTVPEEEYRSKKAEAFKKRTVSNQARNWLLQRNVLIKYIIKTEGLNQIQINDIFKINNVQPLGQQAVSLILKELAGEGELGEIDLMKENQ